MAPRSTWRQVTFHPPPSLNLQRTFSLSSPFSALASTVSAAQGGAGSHQPKGKKRVLEEEQEAPPEETPRLIRALHVRLRLNTQQREQVILAIAVQRAAFNFAAELVNRYNAMPFANKLRDAWFDWKAGVRCNRFGDSHLYRYIVNAGTHTKIDAQGIRQFADAHKAGRAKAQAEGKNPNSAPPPGFRSARKLLRETLILEKGATGGPLRQFLPVPYVERKQRGLCLVKIGGDQFTRAGNGLGYFLLEDKVEVIERLVREGSPRFDGKITWDKRIGAFHLVYLYELPQLPDPDPAFENKRIVATDPGVYPFQAWYSPTSGEHGRLLEGETDKMMSRGLAIDKLQSRIDRFQGGRTRRRRQRWRTRKRLRRRLARERVRLTNWVKGAHYDCANLLLHKHDLILQPTLETARLSSRASRRIQSSTVRKMMTWSHYRFVQRLESKAPCYAGRHVIKCKEPGTSKTCTNCGFWKANLRVSDKRYECPRCHIIVDRQLAGARNNFFAAYGAAVGVGWDGVDG